MKRMGKWLKKGLAVLALSVLLSGAGAGAARASGDVAGTAWASGDVAGAAWAAGDVAGAAQAAGTDMSGSPAVSGDPEEELTRGAEELGITQEMEGMQQFLNEVLGRSGTAHKRCGVGAEGLVVTDVKFLPGSGVFPVDPGYEIFSLGPLHLHNYMSPPPGNRDERCFTAPKAGLAAKGTVANISILHQYIGNSDIFLSRSNRPYFYIFQLKNGVKTTFIPDSARWHNKSSSKIAF